MKQDSLKIPALKDKKNSRMNLVDLPVYRLISPVEGPRSYVHVEKGGKTACSFIKGKNCFELVVAMYG